MLSTSEIKTKCYKIYRKYTKEKKKQLYIIIIVNHTLKMDVSLNIQLIFLPEVMLIDYREDQ